MRTFIKDSQWIDIIGVIIVLESDGLLYKQDDKILAAVGFEPTPPERLEP